MGTDDATFRQAHVYPVPAGIETEMDVLSLCQPDTNAIRNLRASCLRKERAWIAQSIQDGLRPEYPRFDSQQAQDISLRYSIQTVYPLD
jgi:hypothetical protein